MRKLVLLSLILLSVSISSFGWGPTGHRATSWIAHQYLNKNARKAIDLLLQEQSIAIASTWMDDVRSDSAYDYMTDWHWVTIPFGQTYDQTEKNPNGDIIQTLERL